MSFESMEQITRFTVRLAQKFGEDVYAKLREIGEKIDVETGIENLGNNVAINAVGFVLDQFITDMAQKATGRPREELFKEISFKHQKSVHDLLAEYSKDRSAIMIDLSEKQQKGEHPGGP